jgi:hypothetical protein
MSSTKEIKLPKLGRYVRRAEDHPNRNEGSVIPRGVGEEVLIVEETRYPDQLYRHVIGKIKSVGHDDYRDYATSVDIFNDGGWERQEVATQ